jgi:hypothetical protein
MRALKAIFVKAAANKARELMWALALNGYDFLTSVDEKNELIIDDDVEQPVPAKRRGLSNDAPVCVRVSRLVHVSQSSRVTFGCACDCTPLFWLCKFRACSAEMEPLWPAAARCLHERARCLSWFTIMQLIHVEGFRCIMTCRAVIDVRRSRCHFMTMELSAFITKRPDRAFRC